MGTLELHNSSSVYPPNLFLFKFSFCFKTKLQLVFLLFSRKIFALETKLGLFVVLEQQEILALLLICQWTVHVAAKTDILSSMTACIHAIKKKKTNKPAEKQLNVSYPSPAFILVTYYWDIMVFICKKETVTCYHV